MPRCLEKLQSFGFKASKHHGFKAPRKSTQVHGVAISAGPWGEHRRLAERVPRNARVSPGARTRLGSHGHQNAWRSACAEGRCTSSTTGRPCRELNESDQGCPRPPKPTQVHPSSPKSTQVHPGPPKSTPDTTTPLHPFAPLCTPRDIQGHPEAPRGSRGILGTPQAHPGHTI